ncbi:MAG TPA: integrin [Herpetosiphonaceae bacterium]
MYVKASNPDIYDAFHAVALDGDTLVVGAPGEKSASGMINGDQADNSLRGAGAAYVFVRANGVWAQQAYLKPADPREDAYFGSSVAIDGDTIAVGAYGEATGGYRAGAAYVFVRANGTWTQQARLKAPQPQPNDTFGLSLALAGDTLAVGGVRTHVFARAGQAWGHQAALAGAQPWYGASLALDARWLVIGAPYEAGTGVADVYERADGRWLRQARLLADNAEADDYFGTAVALGEQAVIVGAPGEDSVARGVGGDPGDNGAQDSGAAYVFGRSGDQWAQQAYLKASNADAGKRFGSQLAASGDWAIVAGGDDSGAVNQQGDESDTSQPQSGAAYFFRRNSDGWRQWVYQKASNTEAFDQFGGSMAMSGTTVAVSSMFESSGAAGINGDQADNSREHAGAVYLASIPQQADLAVRCYGQILAGGQAVNLGFAAPGAAVTRTFTIENRGGSLLTLTASPPVALEGGAGAISLASQPASELVPFSATSFAVRFAPPATGSYSATLVIRSDDPDSDPVRITVHGWSSAVPPIFLPLIGQRAAP